MPLMQIKTKVKRKSQREVRLGEYVDGFYDCLHIFEEGFREEANKEDAKRRIQGRSTLISITSKEPRIDALWSRIEKAMDKIRAKSNEYSDLRASRI